MGSGNAALTLSMGESADVQTERTEKLCSDNFQSENSGYRFPCSQIRTTIDGIEISDLYCDGKVTLTSLKSTFSLVWLCRNRNEEGGGSRGLPHPEAAGSALRLLGEVQEGVEAAPGSNPARIWPTSTGLLVPLPQTGADEREYGGHRGFRGPGRLPGRGLGESK